jgi:hypothetical protein
MKDFKALEMGVVELQKGKGPATLRALKITGSQAIEVEGLLITRLD